MMKKIIFAIALLFCMLGLHAHTTWESDSMPKTRDIYLEIGGPSIMGGVTYEQRFNNHTRWGWRAGFGFGYSENNGFLTLNGSTRAWTLPLGVNYMIGSRRNALELDLGVSVGLYNGHNDYGELEIIDEATYNKIKDDPHASYAVYTGEDGKPVYVALESQHQSKTAFGYFFFGNIGYRHVSKQGFLFRVGLTPTFNFGDSHAVSVAWTDSYPKVGLTGYLSFGWAF
jgi:hypothetical protein